MKVELRVMVKKEVGTTPKRGRPKTTTKVAYTPAIIDPSKVEFAYIDQDGELNIKYIGTDEYFTVKNTNKLMDRLDAVIEKRFPEVKGLR